MVAVESGMMEEKDRYDEVCKGQFESLHAKIANLSDRLFIDNGSESLQSKMNRHDIWIKRATGVGIAVAIAVSGLCIDAVQEIIKGIIR